jgi:ATP-dependent DNA helicase DinG
LTTLARKLSTRRNPTDGEDLLPEPYVIGLPAKFKSWRLMQQAAVVAGQESAYRWVVQCAPTGFGKSLMYMGNAKLTEGATGGRTIILTSTKGLQQQLDRDFGGGDGCGAVQIRGQNSYPCRISTTGQSVADGPCHLGHSCRYRETGCEYFDAVAIARKSAIVVTNYSYWLYQNTYGEGLGPFDLMVCDEAHDAPEILADFLSVELDDDDFHKLKSRSMGAGAGLDEWRQWATYHVEAVESEVKALKLEGQMGGNPSPTRYKAFKKLLGKLQMLTTVNESWRVHDAIKVHGQGMKSRREAVVQFNVLWPKAYAHRLFMSVPKVIMVSATVRPKTMALFGLTEGKDYEFLEYPSTFPVSRRPVIHVPTIRLSYRSDEGDMALWMSRIDQIIRDRRDRKGIVHTVSYKRRNFILANSEFRSMMVTHDSRDTRDVVEQWKLDDRPSVLVSPSMATGWDFPYDQCRYQIIGKLPFPDTKEGISKDRAADDKDWPMYVTMQQLVQATGRSTRAEDDWSEVFIIDNNVGWYLSKYGRVYAPKWWLESYRVSQTIPAPLNVNLPT